LSYGFCRVWCGHCRTDRVVAFSCKLLKRVFKIDVLECPHCGARCKVLAVISDPFVVTPLFTTWSSPRLVKAPRPRPSPSPRLAARPLTLTSNLSCRGESGRVSGHARPVDWPLFALAKRRALPCFDSTPPFCASRWRFSPLAPRSENS
jgi:hypothetical protein